MKLNNPMSHSWISRLVSRKNLRGLLYFILIGIVCLISLPFLTYILFICFVSYLFIKLIRYIPKTSLKRV